ncbi:MAG: hypothetical protein Q9227_001329 [Pyrenula ochraceoflavens]
MDNYGYDTAPYKKDWVSREYKAEEHAAALSAAFRRRSLNGDRYPLLWAMHDVFKFEFWLQGFATFCANNFQIGSPLVLRYLLQFLSRPAAADTNYIEGILLCFAMFLTQCLMSLGIYHWMYLGEVLGAETKAAVMNLTFQKSLKLSAAAKAGSITRGGKQEQSSGWTEGKIVNLISTDTTRIGSALQHGHLIWTAPLMVIFCLTLLFINLGWNVLPGLALLILATEGVKRVSSFAYARRAVLNKILDRRVELTKELLHAMQFIKSSAWEETFLKHIFDIRTDELHHLKVFETTANAYYAIAGAVPLFTMALTFAVFTVTGNAMQPATIFSSLALFNCLRMPLIMVPLMITEVANAFASIIRIQDFLSADESKSVTLDPLELEAISLTEASFEWTIVDDSYQTGGTATDGKLPDEQRPLLSASHENIEDPWRQRFVLRVNDLKIHPFEFVAVTGRVGSGKSSLLSALGGDMIMRSGHFSINGLVVHCTQTPFILSGSIRSNITFGKVFDEERFDQVLDACALRVDLDMMPNGSETRIGERGVTLSGGQKQRLGLARALYSECPIILLDDPLSTVDARVGQHILENAIFGPLLNGRCVVLATHQLHVLPRAHRIIWMDHGLIKAVDSYDALRRDFDEFDALVKDLAAHPTYNPVNEESSVITKDEKDDAPVIRLIEDEYQDVGVVSFDVYKVYFASAGYLRWFFTLVLTAFAQSTSLLNGLVLVWWTSDTFGLSTGVYIATYAGVGVVQYFLLFAYFAHATLNGLVSSNVLFRTALSRVSQAPMSFFNVTPAGRLLSLFTRDVDLIDTSTSAGLKMLLSGIALVCGTIVLMIGLLPLTAPVIVVLAAGCFHWGRYYRRSARELKRHEAVLRSICMAQSTEAINGSSTIRAYRAGDVFSKRLNEAINDMSAATHLIAAVRQWMTVRLEMIGNILVLLVALLVVAKRDSLDPSLSGLILTYALALVNQLGYLVQNAGRCEDDMVPVERINYYSTAIPNEFDYENDKGDSSTVPSCWPLNGDVRFENLTLHYTSTSSTPALLNVSISLPASSMTAIVGRTGAGKSSFLASLYRMTPSPTAGVIYIDGVPIPDVPLAKLRSSISLVTQDPVCWKGSVRDNVDPQHSLPEARIEAMLQRCGLLNDTTSAPDSSRFDSSGSALKLKLTTELTASGANLSLGQRQLLSLARALLRNTRILVLDEATSALDKETDNRVLDLVREEARERGLTVVFVAHRIESVKRLGVNKVVVLEAGNVMEEGTPAELYANKGSNGEGKGRFRDLCLRSAVVF